MSDSSPIHESIRLPEYKDQPEQEDNDQDQSDQQNQTTHAHHDVEPFVRTKWSNKCFYFTARWPWLIAGLSMLPTILSILALCIPRWTLQIDLSYGQFVLSGDTDGTRENAYEASVAYSYKKSPPTLNKFASHPSTLSMLEAEKEYESKRREWNSYWQEHSSYDHDWNMFTSMTVNSLNVTAAPRPETFDLPAPQKKEANSRTYVGETLMILYLAPDGGNLLTNEAIADVYEMEQALKTAPGFTDYCRLSSGGGCLPPNSIINFLYPTVAGGEIYFDGRGSDEVDVVPAVTLLLQNKRAGFFSRTTSIQDPTSDSLISTFQFGLPLDGRDYSDVGSQRAEIRAWMGDLESLFQKYDNKNGFRILREGGDLFAEEIDEALHQDIITVAISVIVIFLYIWFHTGSLFLTAASVFHMACSFPPIMLWYRYVFGDLMNVMNVVALWLILGIGADDVFVFVDTWNQFPRREATRKHSKNLDALAAHLSWTWRKSCSAMLVTSLTTAAGFYSTAISRLLPLREFGFFLGGVVSVNYLFMITWFPAIVVIHTKYRCPCYERCVGRLRTMVGLGSASKPSTTSPSSLSDDWLILHSPDPLRHPRNSSSSPEVEIEMDRMSGRMKHTSEAAGSAASDSLLGGQPASDDPVDLSADPSSVTPRTIAVAPVSPAHNPPGRSCGGRCPDAATFMTSFSHKLYRVRWIVLALTLAMVIGLSVQIPRLRPPTDLPQLLPADSNIEMLRQAKKDLQCDSCWLGLPDSSGGGTNVPTCPVSVCGDPGSLKKCEGIICQNAGQCKSGICQCAGGWTGSRCESKDLCYQVNCGSHGYCSGGTCRCYSGWTGGDCSVPVPPPYQSSTGSGPNPPVQSSTGSGPIPPQAQSSTGSVPIPPAPQSSTGAGPTPPATQSSTGSFASSTGSSPTAQSSTGSTPTPPTSPSSTGSTPVPPQSQSSTASAPTPPQSQSSTGASSTGGSQPQPPQPASSTGSSPTPQSASSTGGSAPQPPQSQSSTGGTPVPPQPPSSTGSTPVPPQTQSSSTGSTPTPPQAQSSTGSTPVPPTQQSSTGGAPIPPVQASSTGSNPSTQSSTGSTPIAPSSTGTANPPTPPPAPISPDLSLRLQFVWGISGVDMSSADTDNNGVPEFSPTFLPSAPEAQLFLANACDELMNRTDIRIGMKYSRCVMGAFRKWVGSTGHFPVTPVSSFVATMASFLSQNSAYGEDVGFVMNDEAKPDVSAAQSISVHTLASLPSLQSADSSSSYRISFIHATFLTYIDREQGGLQLEPSYNLWQGVMDDLNSRAPGSVGEGFQASDVWSRMRVELAFIKGTIQSIILSVATVALTILFFTHNLWLMLFTVGCILSIVACLLGLFVLWGWSLGAMEAISVPLVVGLSVDYSLHLGHAYNHAGEIDTEDPLHQPALDRVSRMRSALISIGPSVVSAAVTTIASMSILIFCKIHIFQEIGIIVSSTLFLGIYFSMVIFSVLCQIWGPEREQGNVLAMSKRAWKWIKNRTGDSSESVGSREADLSPELEYSHTRLE